LPFIHIKSLPFESLIDIPSVIIEINKDFAETNNIPLEHVHTIWELFEPGHFAKGDIAPKYQPPTSHSVLVDLLTPDFNSMETVKTMLRTLAKSISIRAKIPIRKIFINHRQAFSGMVFDDGDIVEW
jgi:hypothetical protein